VLQVPTAAIVSQPDEVCRQNRFKFGKGFGLHGTAEVVCMDKSLK